MATCNSCCSMVLTALAGARCSTKGLSSRTGVPQMSLILMVPAGKSQCQAGPPLLLLGCSARQQPRAAGCGRRALHGRGSVWAGRQPRGAQRSVAASRPGLDRSACETSSTCCPVSNTLLLPCWLGWQPRGLQTSCSSIKVSV